MGFAKIALAAAAVCLMTSGAYAEDVTNDAQGCRVIEKQVKEAFTANAQSPNLTAASDERNSGRDGCRMGYYAFGISHYKKALEILAGH
jgi:hypothetical protein